MGACEGLTISDPDPLDTVMEAREQVESEDDPTKLAALREKVAAEEARCVEAVRTAFGAGHVAAAAAATTALRYLERVREAITEKL